VGLPVFELTISEDINDNSGVDYVSLVDFPAIEKDFLAFSKAKLNYAIQDEEKRIVSGAAMIADLPIYRNSDKNGEHYTVFKKDTIFKIVKKRSKMQYQNNVNLMHDAIVDGVFEIESYIIDRDRGIMPPKGFEDVADGSWFLSYYIENEDVWQKVKSGEFKGFSIEGFFDYKQPTDEEQNFANKLEQAINIIKKYVK
jgi:hypothetical protein